LSRKNLQSFSFPCFFGWFPRFVGNLTHGLPILRRGHGPLLQSRIGEAGTGHAREGTTFHPTLFERVSTIDVDHIFSVANKKTLFRKSFPEEGQNS
jgi:hypothetical protein